VKAFVNARIFDGTTESLSPHTSIVVRDDGRIDSVGGPDLEIGSAGEVVDCGGLVVYPGLIDMHSHLQEESLGLLIRHGVTTARDVGNDLDLILTLRTATSSGAVLGPRIHCAGPLLDGERPMWPEMAIAVADERAAAAAVSTLASAGVDGIKLYMGILPGFLRPIVETAQAHGLPVTAHLGAATCLEAARSGVGCLEHACQALYAALVPAAEFLVWDKRWTLGQSRYWAGYYRGWAKVDPDGAQVTDVLSELRDLDVALDPTLLVNQRLVDWAVDPGALSHLESLVDPAVSRDWVANAEWFTADWSAADTSVAVDALAVVGAVVARFAGLGGTIVAGTDAPFSFLVPGISMHEELQSLVAAGLLPGQALRAATGTAAERLGWAADVGTVRPGRFADLVICAGDPLRSISDSAAISEVYKGGELAYAAALAPELRPGPVS
jgi:imidazolonepropionase-like amidohydrolase